ncbi:hypothetical protein KQ910_12270 [Reyranella sp. MMS21-HV4-11]|uniref:Uncharacterized protein n=1 Tax=Reyranella humidisoli TaxID=2849149 RepID=A0ABS6IJD1_9HYPH|nr:hypothetical protein [Reyranella sp. MMS21-HV4-11]MBU8874540.1 hypothetical protein [Reyranella sp. MMS21-HV4-11]
MATPVNLTYHLSATLLSELTQGGSGNGVNAYLWYNAYAAGGNLSPFTTVISNGVANGGTLNNTTGTTDWDLTLTTDASVAATQVSGGKVYLIIQSNPTSTPTANDLTTLIGTTEGNINPANAVAWNFSYDTFEVALANNTADVADLSAINSFGHQFGISAVIDGAVVARGYNSTYDAEGIAGLINTAAAGVPDPSTTAPVIDFPTGSTLAGTPMIAITPATDNGQQAPPYNPPPTTPNYTDIWQASNWQTYVTTVGGLSGVELVGHFNGASDAKTNGVYHNAGYYDYTVAAQAISGNATLSDGNYFILSPTASSQIKGYIAISETSLMGNLYSPGLASAPAYIFTDSALLDPYTIENTPSGTPAGETNTGRNDQWGNIFTQLFTGFTGGYFGGTGVSIPASESNPHAPTNTVNLNQNYNWDPTYAFDGARASGTTLTGQHYDPYAKIFFDNSNVYGTAYGDALTTQFTASVTLPVYSGSSDVANIDLWAFGSSEKMTTVPGTGGSGQPPLTQFYAPYTINNYLAPGGADYAVPTAPSAGNNLSLNLANNGLVVDPDTADIQLGIYLGNGQFQYIDLPSGAAQNDGGPWQNWQITQDTSKPAGQQFAIESIPIPANFSATPPTAYVPYTASGQVGALGFDNLPAVASATNWYQLIVGGKTFNFYATLDGSSYVTALAADGLASITPPAANQTSMSLLLVPGSMNALPGALMEAYATESTIAATVQPTSPVAGTLSGPPDALVLSAIQTGAGLGQSVNLNSSVYLTATTSLGFGWTGESNSANQPSWISGATNKILASDIARVEAVDLLTGLSAMVWNVTPDIDGQWLTPTSFSFTAGAYAVTMTEMLSDGSTPFGKASSPVYVVVSATGAITGAAAEISGALDAYQAVNASLTSIAISDGQPLTIDWADITADAQALALIPGGAYTLNVVDSSTTIMANIAALNGNAKVAGIGFTDATPPTLTFTNQDYTTYQPAIGKMMGERTIAVTGVTGESYGAFNQIYKHGVLSSGANGDGVLALTQQLTTGYSSAGPITSAASFEHEFATIDSAIRTVRDIYTTAVFATMPAPYPVAAVSGYPSPGPSNLTFTSVQYDYANDGTTHAQSTYTYANTSGPPGSITEVDVFDVNNRQISQAFSGFNPQATNGVAEKETTFATINGAQVITSTKNVYEYSTPVNGNHYTMAEETLDSSGRELRHVFSGLFGLEGQIFTSYQHDFLGGVHSGSKYASDKIEDQAFTKGEIWLDADSNVSKIIFGGVTSQPYSSYSYDYSYDNGAWGGGSVVAQTYFYTNVEGQPYWSYEVELDGAGSTTSITYSGYTVTATQPYASLEYFYSGGSLTGAYNGYIDNIAGKNWTGEVHGFDTSGQLVQQIFTGVTNQPYTSYENDYASGVLSGQKFYYTNVQNQGYLTYEVDLTSTGALALEIYDMNDGSHRIIGSSISQTIDSIYNDLTTGGGGADVFSYTPFFGDATITDFTSGTDQISLSTSEFANFAYVQANSSVVGGNTVIDGSNGDSITLQGITTLQESDFLFV